MIRNFFRKILFFVFVFVCSACAKGNEMILESKDIQFFKIEEIKRNNDLSLLISGLAFHSSLAVKKIETKIEGESLIVFVYLTPTRAGLSGSFSYELEIPSSVNSVRFGNGKNLIWKR